MGRQIREEISQFGLRSEQELAMYERVGLDRTQSKAVLSRVVIVVEVVGRKGKREWEGQ